MNKYDVPDVMYARVPKLSAQRAYQLAQAAVIRARELAPKGYLARGQKGMTSRFLPYYGEGYFGIRWADNYAWFQEHGAQPFTMKNLAGKTIPMWIKDPTGKERKDNPKAETRVTESGITEVLIFRRVAEQGAKKTIKTKSGQTKEVPASYPGAAGRIAVRHARHPLTSPGKVAGAIHSGNVGVRWRNPGMTGRHFFQQAITESASRFGVMINTVVARHPSGQEELIA